MKGGEMDYRVNQVPPVRRVTRAPPVQAGQLESPVWTELRDPLDFQAQRAKRGMPRGTESQVICFIKFKRKLFLCCFMLIYVVFLAT